MALPELSVCVSPQIAPLKPDKPPYDDLIAITRGQGVPGFYLCAPLLGFLKSFHRALKLRIAYGSNWEAIDKIALDDELSKKVFHDCVTPELGDRGETDDPVARGFERNLPLCAFHWVMRRFIEASRYCLVCLCLIKADIRAAVLKCQYRRIGHMSAIRHFACIVI